MAQVKRLCGRFDLCSANDDDDDGMMISKCKEMVQKRSDSHYHYSKVIGGSEFGLCCVKSWSTSSS